MTDSSGEPKISGVQVNNDGLESLISGMGDPTRDKAAATYYSGSGLGDIELENGYRFGWIIPKIVDTPAKDALRKWRDWSAEADQITALKKAEKKLQVKLKVIEAYTKARLWGGGAIFVNTGQRPEIPLNLNLVKKDGIKSLTVFSRRELVPEHLVMDPFDANYGKPEFYNVANTTEVARIHHSHLVRFNGNDFPDPWNTHGLNYGWGDSIVQRVYQAAKNADSTSSNIASLVFEANIDVFSIPSFTAKMADKLYEQNMLKRFALAARGKSIVGTLMHDSEEKYERKQINFSELPEVLRTFMQVVAAAANMPNTKFFGSAPQGMNATGEGDMKNYHDDLSCDQELKIEPQMTVLDECLIRHALGNRPDEVDYRWTPLEQMNEKEIAEIGDKTAKTIETLGRTGLYMPEVLEEAGTNQLVKMGVFPGLDNLVSDNRKDFEKDFDLGGDEPETGESD